MKSKFELISYTDAEIFAYVKDEWGVPDAKDITVIGLLQARKNKENRKFFTLRHIKNEHNVSLEYPVLDLDSVEKMSHRGVFVPPMRNAKNGLDTALQEGVDVHIQCKLSLASKLERDKHKNPTFMNVVALSVKPLKSFVPADFTTDNNGNIHVKDSVYNTIFLQKKNEIEDDVNARRVQIEGELNYDIKVLEKVSADFKEKNVELASIKLVGENLLKEQEEKQSENINKLDKSKQEISFLESELSNLKEAIKNDEENQMKKLERFKSFVKSKADTLLKLEFIDQNEYDELLLTQKTKANQHNSVNFHQELEGDFSSAAAHIQAFLFNKDILYPRYIIEDFFALIQTNDLIILAGESGSGKTNLVKSFASAVGGVSKIIPVKPNWTSSEDLLGYYNPL